MNKNSHAMHKIEQEKGEEKIKNPKENLSLGFDVNS